MPAIKRKQKNNTEPKKSKKGFALGVIIVIFAFIGVVTIISLAASGVKKLTDNSKKFTEYEQFLAPVVMNDPDPFDDVSRAQMSQLIDAAIWSLMKSGLDADKYEYTQGDTVGLIVPKEDVEKQFEKLFGSDVKPVHATAEGGSYTFSFDESRQAYIVPLTGVMPTFIPRVLSQSKKGDTVVLTVGYISGDDWDQDEHGSYIEPSPSKYMKITLRLKGDAYYISALQNTDAPETASTTKKAEETAAPEESSELPTQEPTEQSSGQTETAEDTTQSE